MCVVPAPPSSAEGMSSSAAPPGAVEVEGVLGPGRCPEEEALGGDFEDEVGWSRCGDLDVTPVSELGRFEAIEDGMCG